MIYGIGTDICALSRIKDILQKQYSNKFVSRILTESEQATFTTLSDSRKVEFLAGRFALKEAVSKAIGTGIGSIVGFLDIHISKDERGKPICALSPATYAKLHMSDASLKINVTLTHEKEYVIAFVVIEQL